jgi:hypothetical protein
LLDDGPPSADRIADAARFAADLGLKAEGNHWRGECPSCHLPDSLTLNARAHRVECRCDSGVCDPFTLEAQLDGRLSAHGLLNFREWPWKRAAIALETGGLEAYHAAGGAI